MSTLPLEAKNYSVAHNLQDTSRQRSKDVELDEDVSFRDLMLARGTLAGLDKCGFERPSPIQLKTIPLARCGLDLVVQSKAGTGKTCIFALAALEALNVNTTSFTQTLIVAPTREIAAQIHEVVTLIGSEYPNLRCALCIGGVEVKQDRANLAPSDKSTGTGACQIVVGTPGRLKQLIELGVLKTQQMELFVLDEADKLIEEQFKCQVDDIYKRLPADKQMIATSATYPTELAELLSQYMQSPTYVRVGEELSLEAVQEFYLECKAGQSSKKSLTNKLESLAKLLNQSDFSKCFVFTNFQARAPQICDALNKDKQFVGQHGQTSYLCAELGQDARNSTFANFKNSSQKVLVSTDISARGIDIQDIELVINFDLPVDNATYYHRIGRAGRFGQPGRAVSLVSSESIDQSVFKKSIRSSRINKLNLPD